jgi:hypothetical protein
VIASCSDLELALRGDDPSLAVAFRTHALACVACREELALWDGISAAAPSLRKEWPSPGLEARIRSEWRAAARPRWRPPTTAFVALAAAASLVIGLLVFPHRSLVSPGGTVGTAVPPDLEAERLISEKALAEVEQAQKAYVQAIDALSKVAAPRLANEGSAVFAAYREKLLVLDSAIEECRAQAEQNRFNAHLRLELLSIYQEKQRTLESLLHEDPHAS